MVIMNSIHHTDVAGSNNMFNTAMNILLPSSEEEKLIV